MPQPSRARHARSAMTAMLLLAVGGACSTSSQPAQLGNCVPVDGGSCTVTSSGGGSSGGSDSGGSCSDYSAATACDACEVSSCCSQLMACSASAACQNLYNCETACQGAPACNSTCQNQYPTGTPTLNLLVDCVTDRCTVCAESGIGDPCTPPYPPCETGLTCSNGWCTETCVHSTGCAGLGANGLNDLGEPNYCLTPSYHCAPGCGAQATDCSYYPGTYCLTTATDAENQTVSVCASLPDAGVKD